MKKILIVFGTRPEAIKMAPLVKELINVFKVIVCVTGQHREMLDQVLRMFNITPDYDLKLMKPDQDLYNITCDVINGMKVVLVKESPDLVLIHGDTTTAMATSISAYYSSVPVGHIEAGLRTNEIYSPFPEEINRQIVARIAQYHFAPTEKARNNLIEERIPKEKIVVTGNTVIDSLLFMLEKARKEPYQEKVLKVMPFLNAKPLPRIILVTGHRRENFGKGFSEICNALKSIALAHPEVHIIYPVHLNPNVQKPVSNILSGINNLHLLSPLGYLQFVKLMDACYLIITDSGGIQEEAPSLGKPVLLMRDTTERPESIEAGTVKLVGANKENIVSSVNLLLSDELEYLRMVNSKNPYGDGSASAKICISIKNLIK